MSADQDRVTEAGDGQPAPARVGPAVVGIGASAGGVQALQTFFEALPDKPGAAFVVVIHLDPETHSELAPIIGARTVMPVAQVETPVSLEANHVYVIPPNRRLRITGNEIAAVEFDEPHGRRASIDMFFRSLADQHGDAFAVVLTGAGSDGAAGVKAVKEAGGIILVQDPKEADYASMPRSAIATGMADFVLPLRKLAKSLADLLRYKDRGAILREDSVDDDLLERVLANLHARTGHDFSKYKRSTVLRRIARRMQVNKRGTLAGYYKYLSENVEEARHLLGDLLISVTTFFRDPAAFEALSSQALAPLLNEKNGDEPLRVWVPGCATGEEAYTIGILLLEAAARHDMRPALQVFGSDLDAGALGTAREGRYPLSIEADVSEERLRRNFAREGDHYLVRRELRDIVLFASHSVLKDPPFSRLDLVSCRNLLIYLDRDLQRQACATFYYALNANGFLFLGPSESADTPADLFHAVDRKHRIYRSTALAGEKPRLLPRLLGSFTQRETPAIIRSTPPGSSIGEVVMHRRALEQTAPPSILVDVGHRVIHLSDHAGRFLQPAGGPLTGDVVELARPELRFELRSALHQAFDRGLTSLSIPILVRYNGAPHRIYLQVKPVVEDNAPVRQAIVMFIEGEASLQDIAKPEETGGRPAGDDTIRLLSEELQATQARLRTTRAESDTATEELRAANEELQSINEEYRSTSEELETSKEELQSINEELQTVNSELTTKLDAVSRAHGDLQNLMAATDFGTLFLDQTLRIKRFTAPVAELFSIAPSDEGRPITDFTHQLDYATLAEDASAVLKTLAPVEREVESSAGRWYLMRFRPYRTMEDRIDGVVITLIDITDRRRIEQALRDSEARLRQKQELIELSAEPIFVWDVDGGIVEWNRGSEQLYGYSREEAVGKRKDLLLKTIVPNSTFENLRQTLIAHGSWSGELVHHTKAGQDVTVESRIELRPMAGRRLVLETTRDITARKEWERRQRMLLAELSHRVKNTLAIVQSIAHQTLRTAGTRENFVVSLEGRLAALAGAHSLLVETDWKGAEIGALAQAQLLPLRLEDPNRFRMDGVAVMLPADLATPFGLVFHELATNAIKYGAFSNDTGVVTLSWRLGLDGDARRLEVIWRERDGPRVAKPKARGFGTTMIERAIPNATIGQDFRPDGLTCTIELPFAGAREPMVFEALPR